MKELKGKVALITGAGRGQGRSHAVALARNGADVIVSDLGIRNPAVPYPLAGEDDLAETVRLVEAEGAAAKAFTADVRDASQVDAAADLAVEEFGSLDIVCANAGVWSAAGITTMTDEQWGTVIETNLTGVFNTIRAAARKMVDQESGRIICTASVSARQGLANFSNYAAAKWGVLGLMKSAALELAPHRITVNAICPACVRTDMLYKNKALYGLFRPDLDNPTTEDVEDVILQALHQIPDPWIEPEEISEMVVFLASDRARHISGTGIDISAGQSGLWSA